MYRLASHRKTELTKPAQSIKPMLVERRIWRIILGGGAICRGGSAQFVLLLERWNIRSLLNNGCVMNCMTA